MTKNMKIAVILSAQDRMSAVINSAVNRAQRALSSMQKLGATSAAMGAAATATLIAPIKAFADLEDAGLRLKSVMMRDGGVVPIKDFEALNKQAIYLGNLLPGTTADFQNLYATMLEQGTPAKAILNGVGESAAYLAVQLKLPTEEAGKLASRLRLQMGIADTEMMQFMDIISRVKNLGVDPIDMQYAFGRSSGALKLLNIQGLQASKSMGILFTMLMRGGATGETAGTGVSKILSELLNPTKMEKFNKAAKEAGLSFKFFDKGNFLGIENFIAQLTKFQGMNPQKISEILMPLTGGEGQDQSFLSSLATLGADGFNEISKAMADQATLQQKIDIILTSLTNMWEAATGAFTNTMAAFSATFGDDLKNLSYAFGVISEKIQAFIAQHPILFKWTGRIIGSFGILATASGAVLLGISGLIHGGMAIATVFGGIWQAIKWLIPTFSKLHKILLITTNAINFMAVRAMMLGTLIKTVIWPALVQATTAAWGFAASLWANPITWIVAAVIALGAALVYSYYKFDKFRAAIHGLIEVGKILMNLFTGLGKIIAGIFTADWSMMKEGWADWTTLSNSLFNGDIIKAFNSGYDREIAPTKAMNVNKVSSPAIMPNSMSYMVGSMNPNSALKRPMPTTIPTPLNRNSETKNTFNMSFNISGPVDKQNIGTLGREFEDRIRKVIKQENYNNKRLAF